MLLPFIGQRSAPLGQKLLGSHERRVTLALTLTLTLALTITLAILVLVGAAL